jgi:hypothetical protein
MTEIDKKTLAGGWARGIFRVELIERLSEGDSRDTMTTLVSTQDAGFHSGVHTQQALKLGQGYPVRLGKFERPVPLGERQQVASLDLYGDTAVHTEEVDPIQEAQRTAAVQNPASQALDKPMTVRQFVIRIFSRKTAQELGLEELVREDNQIASLEELPLAA